MTLNILICLPFGFFPPNSKNLTLTGVGAIGYGLWHFRHWIKQAWQIWQDSCELTRHDLFKGFSRFHSFLVLAICNVFCLWLGRVLFKFLS
jgi:hypothetical protein